MNPIESIKAAAVSANEERKKANLDRQAQIAEIMADPAAAKEYNKQQEALANRAKAVEQKNTAQDYATSNYGNILGKGAAGAIGGLFGTNFGVLGDTVGGMAGQFTGSLIENMLGNGDVLGQSLEGFGLGGAAASGYNANLKAGQAGALMDAQNDKMREQIISQGEAQAGQFNMSAQAQQSQMTDAAIGQANAFDAGMQGIGMSGIEGSGNMERNLQYGQDKADAQEQLAYDIMGNQQQGIQDSMAQSFDQLSARKADAMMGAFGKSIDQQWGAQEDGRAAAQKYELANQVTMADKQKAIEAAQAYLPQDTAAGAGTPPAGVPPAGTEPAAAQAPAAAPQIAAPASELTQPQNPPADAPAAPAYNEQEKIKAAQAWLAKYGAGINGKGWRASLDDNSLQLDTNLTNMKIDKNFLTMVANGVRK